MTGTYLGKLWGLGLTHSTARYQSSGNLLESFHSEEEREQVVQYKVWDETI